MVYHWRSLSSHPVSSDSRVKSELLFLFRAWLSNQNWHEVKKLIENVPFKRIEPIHNFFSYLFFCLQYFKRLINHNELGEMSLAQLGSVGVTTWFHAGSSTSDAANITSTTTTTTTTTTAMTTTTVQPSISSIASASVNLIRGYYRATSGIYLFSAVEYFTLLLFFWFLINRFHKFDCAKWVENVYLIDWLH